MTKLLPPNKPVKPWMNKMPEWFWDLPITWRFKYKQYHDQWIAPEPEPEEHGLPEFEYPGGPHIQLFKTDNFRCPYCGQAHELRYNYEARDLRLEQDKSDIKTVVLNEYESGKLVNTLSPEPLPGSNWGNNPEYSRLVNPLADMIDITCWTCREKAPKWRWNHAYHNPVLYFQTEEICHCGGELYYQKIVGTDSFGMVCEKCGDYDKTKRMSGSADAEVR